MKRDRPAETVPEIRKKREDDFVVALAGNPNVGKSTVFNALTGMRQHTGNWAGKTVSNAQGYCTHEGQGYVLFDLPGCYSLLAHSAEEEAARDFLCFGGADAAVVVLDATCLERGLNLALQTLELQPRTVICVNLMDEAAKRGIAVDTEKLSFLLGVPVVPCSAKSCRGLHDLMAAVARVLEKEPAVTRVQYPQAVEEAVEKLLCAGPLTLLDKIDPRWLALRLIDGGASFTRSLERYMGLTLGEDLSAVREEMDVAALSDDIAKTLVARAAEIAAEAVHSEQAEHDRLDRRLDRLFTGKRTGVPILLLFLLGIFWLTITGANVPSAWLSRGLFWILEQLRAGLQALHTADWLVSLLVDGALKTLAWVVSVMLPPMAIFFPLFTLLEDFGYLPRVAYNLDRCFQKCAACGKQALTMCMGFGCNAVGVTGARIIDSPRERLLAVLTNSFVPCNGRFPLLITLIALFFTAGTGFFGSLLSAVLLLCVILLGVFMTLLVSFLLSKTVLRGEPSSFTLELPPYRRPAFSKVIVRSGLDRTVFVLGRAVLSALPAGAVIWILANVKIGGTAVLLHCARFLDPFAVLLGLDGVILLAFVLALPANEIVLPIILMAYLSKGTLTELTELSTLFTVLSENGWTWVTALCTVVFSLFHWPCATTLLTIRKETQSLKWTALAAVLPTAIGMVLCALLAAAVRLL